MQTSDSEEEFYDAIDDEAVTPGGYKESNLSFASVDIRTPIDQGTPGRFLTRKSCCVKRTDITFSDMSTGSTSGFHSDYPLAHSKPDEPSFARFVPISTKNHKKDIHEFDGLVLAQEIRIPNSVVIWTAKFSSDGQFLALAGEEGVVMTYRVRMYGELVSPLFDYTPHQTLRSHTKGILDLSWSPSSAFLLSSGMDRQVILWQIESSSIIVKFGHPDVVTSVAFNPHVTSTQNANYFATGCFDRIVRVWNIPQVKVDAYYQASDLITTVAYSPSASTLYVGLKQGQVIIYSSSLTDAKLKFSSELACRNRRGPKARGRKVTGFDFFNDSTFLISTNDSRIRMYTDHNMTQKYKGHKAEHGPIKATFSHNLMHVISGSEIGSVYIWNSYNTFATRGKKTGNRNERFETFVASKRTGAAIYTAIFAPGMVVRALQERAISQASSEIVSHVIVTAGAEGVLRVYYNCHTRVG